MRRAITGLAAAAVLAGSTAMLKAQAPARSVWDSVYSADQADSGKELYDAKCALCHGADLAGNASAPALAGGVFIGNWSGQTLGALGTRIQTTMPKGDPGGLSGKNVADVIAYILSVNQYPSGDLLLPSQETLQEQIGITAIRPVDH